MITLTGKYGTAIVYTNTLEETAKQQLLVLLDQDFISGCNVRIMPDTHAGAGCVIGFTVNLGDKVIPNLVGVDIGCGMYVVLLGKNKPDLSKLDYIIHAHVPAGRDIHATPLWKFPQAESMICYKELKDTTRVNGSIGTLGGGNHFIEVDEDADGNYYLVIHSGSRSLGKQVAEYYQQMAVNDRKNMGDLKAGREAIIKSLKDSKNPKMISAQLRKFEDTFRKAKPTYPEQLCFLNGEHRNQYLNDMLICQDYARLNREMIARTIVSYLDVAPRDEFHAVHNYISFSDGILRKGAVSALKGERLIIPINMSDGSIIAYGKGNADWNNSAPHGAGRLMGRNEAKRQLSMDSYAKRMEGIFTTTATESTLDESPDAYKPMAEILENIQDTVTVDKIIKPIYNFKAAE